MLAGEEVQEAYPTTEALLDKLQEVLEKADVEVCFLQALHCTSLHCTALQRHHHPVALQFVKGIKGPAYAVVTKVSLWLFRVSSVHPSISEQPVDLMREDN